MSKSVSAVNVSQPVLERTPNRALTFLKGIHFSPIRATMQRAGFTNADYKEGFKLVYEACGFEFDGSEMPVVSDEVAEAVKELDGWDESGFRRARAALNRLHPEQAAFVFKGLAASQGMQAVMGVMTFLDRLDALEGSPERKSTRKADKAALETLAQRGIDASERARLRKLVKVVNSSPDLDLSGDDNTVQREERRIESLAALRSWFEDWSDTARSVIGRRDYLIRLGLAKKKANGSIVDVGDEEEGDPAPVAPKKTPGKDEEAPVN